jgi:hypothetical protein
VTNHPGCASLGVHLLTAVPAYFIHVRCDQTGTWSVEPEDVPAPVSRHMTETDAEREAMAQAAARDGALVMIHDRYARVRVVRPRRARGVERRR